MRAGACIHLDAEYGASLFNHDYVGCRLFTPFDEVFRLDCTLEFHLLLLVPEKGSETCRVQLSSLFHASWIIRQGGIQQGIVLVIDRNPTPVEAEDDGDCGVAPRTRWCS